MNGEVYEAVDLLNMHPEVVDHSASQRPSTAGIIEWREFETRPSDNYCFITFFAHFRKLAGQKHSSFCLHITFGKLARTRTP